MLRIGLIAAIREEIRPLLKSMRTARVEKHGRFRVYRIAVGTESVCLVESGIGAVNAASATRLLIEKYRPELILNLGFAGSLTPKLNIGDIVIADRILYYRNEDHFIEQQGLTNDTWRCPEINAFPATFVTTRRLTAKKELATKMSGDNSLKVVEMETAAVAEVTNNSGIPLIAVRSISDGFFEEFGFSLDELCDSGYRLQKWRLLLTVSKKPWILPQLFRLSSNSGSASAKLAEAVSALIATLKYSKRGCL